MHITWPIRRLFGSIPGFAFIIAWTDTLNRWLIANRVSPALMV